MKIRYLIASGLFFCVAGCASSSPNLTYYMLAPSALPVAELAIVETRCLVVGPVNLPTYLNRPQVVVRQRDLTLRFMDYQRWAEPLEENIARTVLENLSTLTGIKMVFRHPHNAPKGCPTLRVFMDVVRFDTDEGRLAHLDVRWGLKDEESGKVLNRHSRLKDSVVGEGFPPRAAALNRVITTFSGEVAQAIREWGSPVEKH